jgi:hypothetical protein
MKIIVILQWKLLDVISLGQRQSDNKNKNDFINRLQFWFG